MALTATVLGAHRLGDVQAVAEQGAQLSLEVWT